MSMVQQAIEVSAPLHTVYEQLAAFENYPRFMSGVQRVTPIGHDQTHWIMDVDGNRREFDAQITERSLDERVSWSTTEGPLLAETITLRPMGETKTQIVAQLEADIAFLTPSDRHGQASLTRRLKSDLSTFKNLVESGVLGDFPGGASSKLIANPASVAARIRNRPKPGAGWGTGAAERSNGSDADLPYHGLTEADMGTNVDITSAPGISSWHDLDDVLAPGRRIAKAAPLSGGAAGSARMGGRTPRRDTWGDGMINEEERGSALDM
ncbi:SRPBCC family protein [Actinoplanes sp. NPDC051411]|uniref:SRPBCC family protein n=1 Tax=Actinoplanes sp. NPDC051411 TaxID=3155522 RepID=UPI0034495A11